MATERHLDCDSGLFATVTAHIDPFQNVPANILFATCQGALYGLSWHLMCGEKGTGSGSMVAFLDSINREDRPVPSQRGPTYLGP